MIDWFAIMTQMLEDGLGNTNLIVEDFFRQ